MPISRLTAVALATFAGLGSASLSAATVQTIGVGGTLNTFNTAAPTTRVSTVTISGLAAGTTLAGIDYRPASGRILYGISNVGQVYAINARTGAASAIGAPAFPTISSVGFDFNPTVDRIRVVTQVGQDMRVNPDTGALVATDGALAYAATDANAGAIPTVAGAAYTNSVPGATTTTLYDIDTRGALAPARLVTQGNAAGTISPNSGALFTVGSTGVTSLGGVGFDIGRDGAAYATFTDPTTRITSLYSVNLTTGAATLIGALAGNTSYEGLAIALASFTSMGTTANQAAVGAQLDAFTGIPTGDTLTLLNGIDAVAGTPGAQSAALLALSPAAYSNLPELSLNAAEVSETNVLRYTRDLRGNATMPDGSTATLDAAGKVGAWFLGGARFGSYDAAVDRPATKANEFHFLGGADYRLTPTTAIGAFGGYSRTNAHLTPNAPASVLKSWFGGGYATAAVGPAYIDLWGSYTDLDWGLARRVAVGSFNDTPFAQTDGRVWAGGASTGLSFSFGHVELEPFAAIRYADIRINGFIEAGSSGLAIDRFDRVSVRSNLGVRAGSKFEVAGAVVRPQLRGSWYREYRDQARTINAAFLNPGVSTASFAFTTTPLSKSYFNAGAALNVGGTGPLSMVTDYDVQFDSDREIHSLTLGLRLAL